MSDDGQGATPALSPEQERAVARREGPMLLAAGAGSGKTTVLVERFVADVIESEGLEEGEVIGVGQILAITFTRLAAAELADKIRKRFVALDPPRPDLAAEVEGAWVMTIDAWCARLLRSEAALAGLDPDFAVIEETRELELRDGAWTAALAGVLADPETREATMALLVATDEGQLKAGVEGFHRRRRAAGVAVPELPPFSLPDIDAMRDGLKEAAIALAALLEEAADGKRVQDARVATALCLEQLDDPLGTLSGDVMKAWRSHRGVAVLKEPEADDYYSALDRFARAAAETLMAGQVEALAALIASYGSHYEALKEVDGGLDFADMAIRAKELLEGNPAVAAEERARFRRVLVDEFQDTNPLQVGLLDALGVEHTFMVGDDLQAIYGFRDADVEQFRRRLEIHREAGEAERLSRNYRSTTEVLAFINAGFGRLHDGYEPLVPASGEGPVRVPPPSPPSVPACRLLLVDEAWNEAEGLPEGLLDGFPEGTTAATCVEALAVAEQLAAMVDADECGPADIAVLVRSVASVEPFVRALSRAGVPAIAGSLRGWWERPEVADLISYLSLVANPEDGQALFEVLASPLVGASSSALVLLGSELRRSGALEALERVAAGTGEATAPEADRERIGRFRELLEREREQAPWSPPSVLLERAVAATGYDEAIAAGPAGPEALLRMRRLIRVAHEFEGRGDPDLRGFLDYLRRHRDQDTRVTEAPPGDTGAATVMTMHAAKGLQFPVVVVGALGRDPGGGWPAVLGDEGRIGLRLRDGSGNRHALFDFDELEDERRNREMDEERRLLHVAMTRAKSRLVLCGRVDLSRNWPAAQSIKARPINWLGSSLLEGTGLEGEEAFAELDETVVMVSGGGWEAPLLVTAVRPQDELAERLASLEGVARPDDDPVREPVVVELPPAGGAGAPSTLSYSSLSFYRRCGYRWYLQRVLGLEDRGRPAGAGGTQALARGQAAHILLEGAPLGADDPLPTVAHALAVATSCGLEADEAVARELLELVAAAVSSPVGDRLARSRRELPFSVALGEDDDSPILTGVIDALDLAPGEPALVVDYKTDRVRPGQDLEAGAEERYGIQRAAYALAVLESGQCEEVEVVHLFLERPGEPVRARFSAADLPQLRERLLDAAAGLVAGVFEPAAEPWAGLCGDCPGRGGLCPVPEPMTDREHPG